MKKILFLMVTAAMVLSLCACNVQNEKGKGKDVNSQNSSEIKNEEQTVFEDAVQPELEEENTLEIEGKKYAIPMEMKSLMKDGWDNKYDGLVEELDAEKGADYYGLALEKDGETKIYGVGFYNHTDSSKTLEQCAVFSLDLIGLNDDESQTQCSFTLPGGITEKSTYEDVLDAYGTKNSSENFRVSDDRDAKVKDSETFEKYGFTVLYRSNDEVEAPYNYTFYFNADNTIKHVEIESVNYTSAALAAAQSAMD